MDQQGGQFDAFALFGEAQQRESKQQLRADIMDAFDDEVPSHPLACGDDRPDLWNVVAESLSRAPGGHSAPGRADKKSAQGLSTGASASNAKELGSEGARDRPPASQGTRSMEATNCGAASGERADDDGAEGLATAPSFTYFGANEEHEMEEEDAAFEQALRGRRAPLQRLAEGAREAEQLLQLAAAAATGSDGASTAFAAAPGKGNSRRSGAGAGRSRGKPE